MRPHLSLSFYNCNTVKGKFHYAIMQVADLVADLHRAGIWPITHYLDR